MAETLDKKPQVKDTYQQSKVVRTALQMMQDFDSIRTEKDTRVRRAKDYYLKAVDGEIGDRRFKMPSFILNQLTEIYSTLIRVPDFQVKGLGVSKDVLMVMSMYLEQIIDEGGFYELMTRGWSGFKQQCLFGDFFVQCGYKTDGKIGMPEYRGVSVGNFYTNAQASKLRSKTAGQSATRFGIVYTFGQQELINMPFFKGVEKFAKPGDLPTLSQYDNETDEKTDLQRGQQDKKDYYQVMFFYDSVHEVFSSIVGSNAYEWKPSKGEEYPFVMPLDGQTKAQLPLAHFKLFASPEGIFSSGVGEVFMRLVDVMGDLQTGVANVAIDNKNATAILNIPSVDADDLFGQLKLANKRKEEQGDNTFIVPTSIDGDQAQVGRGDISYLKNETNIEEANQISTMVRQEIRTFGFNLDIFFNQQDTARQSELDIIGQNQTISKFQAENTEDYRFIAEFAMHAIRENGDENDETIFGEGLVLEDGLEVENLGITVGDIVKKFKEIENLKIEVDTKNGFVSNPLLELRSIQRLLQVVPQGSPAQTQLLEALARAEGQSLGENSLQAPAQGGLPPEPQTDIGAVLEQQLNEV